MHLSVLVNLTVFSLHSVASELIKYFSSPEIDDFLVYYYIFNFINEYIYIIIKRIYSIDISHFRLQISKRNILFFY
jgi:hypothetical protein